MIPIRSLIKDIDRKVTRIMASVESIEAQLTGLTSDLEALAASAKAEFEKLETEVKEGKPVNLEGIKSAVEAIDGKVKAAVVPTS